MFLFIPEKKKKFFFSSELVQEEGTTIIILYLSILNNIPHFSYIFLGLDRLRSDIYSLDKQVLYLLSY